MELNFDDILLELGYRVPEGIVDLTKEHQVAELINILKENGYSDANELAQKARVYFSYLQEIEEANKKSNPYDKDTIKYRNDKGEDREILVKTALSYKDDKRPGPQSAYRAALAYIDKKTKGAKAPAGKGKKSAPPKADIGVSSAEKEKEKKKKTKEKKPLKRSESETKRQRLNDATLVNIVKNGLIPTKEKKLSGAGVFDPTDEQLKSALDFYTKRLKNPDYQLDLPNYDVTEEDIDRTIDVMKKELGSDFSRVMSSIQKAGGVDPKLTTGEAGRQRARDIIRLYLQTGGRSAVTGEVVPFNQMQLDHRVPYSNAAKNVAEKKKKGIKTSLLEEQDRLDSPENWDLIETPLNQLKNSLEGNELLNKINKKLSQSPEEKELKKLQQEVQNIREAKLLENLVNSFGKGDFSGLNEASIKNMTGEEIDIVMKAWNWWHPNTTDANNFRKIDPKYDEKLKRRGIQIPPPNHPATIIRMTSQQGGSRSRGVQRPVPIRHKITIEAMKKEKVLQTKKDTIKTDTVLLKAVKKVESGIKDKTSRIAQLKQALKQQKSNKK